MSLLPLLLSTWWTNLDRPNMMDRNLGLAAVSLPDELMFPSMYENHYPIASYDRGVLDFYYKPWMNVLHRRTDGTMNIGIDKDNFKMIIDVQQFKPEEVTIKVIDRYLVVEAKHEETRNKQSSISRQFIRRYQLPEHADVDQVTSTMSSDGILTVTVPLKPKEEKKERVIKIELTRQPALRRDGGDQQPVTETSKTTISSTEKTLENEIREELTTQGQENAKPEK